jgi:hypothetical protein
VRPDEVDRSRRVWRFSVTTAVGRERDEIRRFFSEAATRKSGAERVWIPDGCGSRAWR